VGRWGTYLLIKELRAHNRYTYCKIGKGYFNIFQYISDIDLLTSSRCYKTYVENFETGNIEYTDEVSSLESSLKGHVTLLYEPLEDTIEDGLSQGTNGVGYLLDGPTLGDEFVTDLDLGLGQVPVEISTFNSEKLTDGITDLG